MPDNSFVCCSVSVAPLRRDPAHRSEQLSQLLFGERATIIDTQGDHWIKLRLAWEGYEGWCTRGQVMEIAAKDFKKAARIVCNRHWGKLIFEHGDIELAAGSELTGIKSGKITINGFEGKFKGKKEKLSSAAASGSAVITAAKHYLHAPYQWGGRTLAGIDCSGIVQMAYKLCGITTLRDASQQATEGTTVDFLSEAQAGDLAFFDNAEGRIVHVGILVSSAEIIHATETAGRVVIDAIDGGGIISKTLRRRTHTLRLIKRLVN